MLWVFMKVIDRYCAELLMSTVVGCVDLEEVVHGMSESLRGLWAEHRENRESRIKPHLTSYSDLLQ